MDSKNCDEFWMNYALMLAERTKKKEVPVGAVLVLNNKIISEGWNSPISKRDPTAHAEIIALRKGGKILNNYRLPGSMMYVTLEPCIMCIGAMIHARVKRLIFGAYNNKNVSIKSLTDLLNYSKINHKISLTSGILSQECSEQLSSFFRQLR